MKRVIGLILDFDGTLAPDAVEGAVTLVHQFVCRWKPIPLAFVRQYIRTVSAFRPGPALELLLGALGLAEHLAEAVEFMATSGHGQWPLSLDPDAAAFIRRRRPGCVKVFSSAGPRVERFAALGNTLRDQDFLAYPGRSKSDPDTYRQIAADLGSQPEKWICVDDSPIALWSAKTAGFVTVMRVNSLFLEEDHSQYRPWIDYRINSFAELDSRFRPNRSGDIQGNG